MSARRSRRWSAAFAGIASVLAALVPLVASATVSIAPSPSYDGNYTVSWTDRPAAGQTMYLAQSVNAGAWTKTKMLSTATSKAFTGMAVADYSYKVQFYDIDTETKREIFSHETTA
ncbi:MAG TPA: hypothetical protein VF841_21230 [Anaeromyxobacter sp.]